MCQPMIIELRSWWLDKLHNVFWGEVNCPGHEFHGHRMCSGRIEVLAETHTTFEFTTAKGAFIVHKKLKMHQMQDLC